MYIFTTSDAPSIFLGDVPAWTYPKQKSLLCLFFFSLRPRTDTFSAFDLIFFFSWEKLCIDERKRKPLWERERERVFETHCFIFDRAHYLQNHIVLINIVRRPSYHWNCILPVCLVKIHFFSFFLLSCKKKKLYKGIIVNVQSYNYRRFFCTVNKSRGCIDMRPVSRFVFHFPAAEMRGIQMGPQVFFLFLCSLDLSACRPASHC